MKNKWIWIVTSLVVVLGLLVGGFGCKAPEPTATPTTLTPTSAQPITLQYHCPFAPSYLSDGEEWWMDEVERRTNGSVTFDRIFGGTLGTLDQQPMGIKGGVFDLGMTCNVYNPGAYPASTVTILPFLTTNFEAHSKAGHEIFKDPAIEAEFTTLNSKFLFHGVWDPQEMLSKTPATTIEDLRGLKIRGHGGGADALAAIGITTYAIPFDELPAAAERGVVDAAQMGTPVAARDFGLYDAFDYWIRIRYFYFLPLTMTINLDTWNSLPADIQQVMIEVSEIMPEQGAQMFEAEAIEAWEFLEQEGLQQVEFDPAELQKIRDAGATPVWEKWVTDKTAESIPAQELLDKYFQLVEQYGG